MTEVILKTEYDITFYGNGEAAFFPTSDHDGHKITTDEVLDDMVRHTRDADWLTFDDMEAWGHKIIERARKERDKAPSPVEKSIYDLARQYRETEILSKAHGTAMDALPDDTDAEYKRLDLRMSELCAKLNRLIREILSHPDSTLVAALVKVRLIELQDGFLNNNYSEFAGMLARSLEKGLGIKTPAPEEKVEDILYGIPLEERKLSTTRIVFIDDKVDNGAGRYDFDSTEKQKEQA